MSKHTGRWNEWTAQWILERCRAYGVRTAVICPGSRSTSLTCAAARMPGLETVVHFDERGAGFFALGAAKATESPVVVITTSGTAVANLLPAAVEAAQSRVPLVLLTADRPPELRNCGANQTIDQVHLFGPYVRHCEDLLCSDPETPKAVITARTDATLQAALRPGHQGPVQLNLMFREPFLSGEDAYIADVTRELDDAQVQPSAEIPACSPGMASRLVERIQETASGLLVLGELRSENDRIACREWAEHLGWPCVADVGSGLRFDPGLKHALPHMDLLLTHERLAWLQPETVLWVGGPVVSRRLLEWMGRGEGTRLIRVQDGPVRQDPLHRASDYIAASPAAAWDAVQDRLTASVPSEWARRWLSAGRQVGTCIAQPGLMDGALSEFDAIRLLTDIKEKPFQLLLGNSLPVREADQAAASNGSIVRALVNRGASGIDGLIATGAGAAFAGGIPTMAVVGDLSALHDLNSLSRLREVDVPFLLVVLNNRGGGIFEHLAIREQQDVFERFFATPQDVDFSSAAAAFKIPYQQVNSLSDLNQAVQRELETAGPGMVEVRTDRAVNRERHHTLLADIAKMNL